MQSYRSSIASMPLSKQAITTFAAEASPLSSSSEEELDDFVVLENNHSTALSAIKNHTVKDYLLNHLQEYSYEIQLQCSCCSTTDDINHLRIPFSCSNDDLNNFIQHLHEYNSSNIKIFDTLDTFSPVVLRRDLEPLDVRYVLFLIISEHPDVMRNDPYFHAITGINAAHPVLLEALATAANAKQKELNSLESHTRKMLALCEQNLLHARIFAERIYARTSAAKLNLRNPILSYENQLIVFNIAKHDCADQKLYWPSWEVFGPGSLMYFRIRQSSNKSFDIQDLQNRMLMQIRIGNDDNIITVSRIVRKPNNSTNLVIIGSVTISEEDLRISFSELRIEETRNFNSAWKEYKYYSKNGGLLLGKCNYRENLIFSESNVITEVTEWSLQMLPRESSDVLVLLSLAFVPEIIGRNHRKRFDSVAEARARGSMRL